MSSSRFIIALCPENQIYLAVPFSRQRGDSTVSVTFAASSAFKFGTREIALDVAKGITGWGEALCVEKVEVEEE